MIDRPVDETWTILNDLEFIAPCMPGAQLQEIEGDEYRGVVKIKVGPITAQYKGKASFIEQNETDRVAKLKAEGRDPRQGNANALITATMTPVGDDATTVNIHTDLSLSGKIASFGRGAIEDVSKKILGQFSDNLRDKLAAGTSSAEAATDSAPGAAAPSGAGSSAEPATGSGAAGDAVRTIDSPDPEPVDLLAVSGDSIAKRVAPIIGGLIILVILRWLMRGRAD